MGLSPGLILINHVSSPSAITVSPTPPAPPRTRVQPGAPPKPPSPAPMCQDSLDTALQPVLQNLLAVVHPAPPTLWIVILVSVGLMGLLSVQLMCVGLLQLLQLQQLPQPLQL